MKLKVGDRVQVVDMEAGITPPEWVGETGTLFAIEGTPGNFSHKVILDKGPQRTPQGFHPKELVRESVDSAQPDTSSFPLSKGMK